MKMNYYFAIAALIQFKDRHHLIVNKRNAEILNYLSTIELPQDFDSEIVPDAKTIAANVPKSKQRVHDVLYQSYHDLLVSLGSKPHKVTEYVHELHICTPREGDDKESRAIYEREESRFFSGEFKLPHTPRLGETIMLDFLDNNLNYTSGVVTDIYHCIQPDVHRIVIYVNPTNNYYWKWDRLKKEHTNYELWQRHLKETIRNQKLEQQKSRKRED